MRFLLYIFPFSLILSCNTKEKVDDRVVLDDESSLLENRFTEIQIEGGKFPKNSALKDYPEMFMSFNGMSSYEFLSRTREIIEEKDVQQLQRETTFIFEYTLKSKHKDILNSVKSMNEDDLVQYIVGNFKDDINFHQGSKVIPVDAINYEGKVGANHQVKMYLFLVGLDLEKPYSMVYEDKIFEKGKIEIEFNNPHILG